MTRKRHVECLQHDAETLRQAYLDRFVDTDCQHYRKYVATRRKFSDGLHYEGYIWDCLRDFTRITYAEFCDAVQRLAPIFAMADDHSRDRVAGAPLWPYPPGSVISLSGALLLQLLPVLPEDIYVFDRTVSWTLILTHETYETEEQKRICVRVGVPCKGDPTTASH